MAKIRDLLLGKPRDLKDPHLFHKLSLIAFLAWVGLGADGLSSSAYGPDEAYRAVLDHPEIAILIALATAVTVFIISLAYSRLIEQFPHGGGGYVVATKLLGPSFGVVSGCALLVDYVLTITTSMASAVDQIFSFFPVEWQSWKLGIECGLIVVLIVLNLRGVKESVMVVVPIFMMFVITHAILLISYFFLYASKIPSVAVHVASGLQSDAHSMGLWAMFLLFLGAYSRGAGTYTGIEAVSNGVPMMREPKVQTAKRTMFYMALSLAVTAGGILVCYLIAEVKPVEGQTLNAVLVDKLGFGQWFVILTLCTEGGLLFVAAQTGFLDGPRVMANMALDGWLPQRFSALSEQLTMHYGVLIMGLGSLVSLIYTKGNVDTLVVMYSINVFVTFSLSQAGMCRFWLHQRADNKPWGYDFLLHGVAFALCFGILIMVVWAKFWEGGWITMIVTSLLIALCFLIHWHYLSVRKSLANLSKILLDLPAEPAEKLDLPEPKKEKPTAVILVSGYNGLGVHASLAVQSLFPGHYKQMIFASVGVIDSGAFKGEDELHRLEASVKEGLEKYVKFCATLGISATHRMNMGTDPVASATKLCEDISKEFPRAVFFGGKLVFPHENFLNRFLHNESAVAIQRRLHWTGTPMIILPVRVGYGQGS